MPTITNAAKNGSLSLSLSGTKHQAHKRVEHLSSYDVIVVRRLIFFCILNQTCDWFDNDSLGGSPSRLCAHWLTFWPNLFKCIQAANVFNQRNFQGKNYNILQTLGWWNWHQITEPFYLTPFVRKPTVKDPLPGRGARLFLKFKGITVFFEK
jgi:hypothetical protein